MDIDDLNIGIFLEVFSQFRDVHIHASCIEIIVISPNFLQCQLSLQQIVFVLTEHFQQLVFFGRQSDFVAIDLKLSQLWNKMVTSKVKLNVLLFPVLLLISFQDGLDFEQQQF